MLVLLFVALWVFLLDNIRSSVRLFADDCVLYRNINSPKDCEIPQEDLNSLARWETDWQMKFNVAKCHSMRVTRHLPGKQIQFNYSLHQQLSEEDQSAKYLGITINDSLDWGQHISEITSKATRTLGFLRRNLTFAPRETKAAAYKTLIRPQLEYAAPIWHPYVKTQAQQIEGSEDSLDFSLTFFFVIVALPGLFSYLFVWICRFPLPLDVWEGLRLVVVALPGLFSYLF